MVKKTSPLKSPVTFSLGTVLLFTLVFGAVGGYAIWKSLAAPATLNSATLVASPNPVSPQTTFSLSGCGYAVGKQVNLSFQESGTLVFYNTGVDTSGCISTSYLSQLGSGTESIKAYQNLRGGHKQSLMAVTALVVQ